MILLMFFTPRGDNYFCGTLTVEEACVAKPNRHFVLALACAVELGGQSEHEPFAGFESNFNRCMWRMTDVA